MTGHQIFLSWNKIYFQVHVLYMSCTCLVEELVSDEGGNLLLDLPGLGDGAQVAGRHQHAADQLLVVSAGPIRGEY